MGLVVGSRDILAEVRDLARREAALAGGAPVRGRAPFESWHLFGAPGEPALYPGYGPLAGYGPPAFARTPGGRTYLRGVISITNTINTTVAFVLPVGYRSVFPRLSLLGMAWTYNATVGAEYRPCEIGVYGPGSVYGDGTVRFNVSASNNTPATGGWVSLDGCHFTSV